MRQRERVAREVSVGNVVEIVVELVLPVMKRQGADDCCACCASNWITCCCLPLCILYVRGFSAVV